jgi:protein transport protein SEC61 subunit gamma-like protein
MEENQEPQNSEVKQEPPKEEPKIEKPKKPLFKKKEKDEGPSKLKLRLMNYRRVLEVSRKPDKEELTASSKITGIGIGIIGLIGFIIYLLYALIV